MSRRVVSSSAMAVFVIMAALSVGAFAVLRNGVERQDAALVKDGAAQVALVLQAAAQNLQTELRSLAYFTATAGYSSTVFDEQAKGLRTDPKASVALIETSGSSPRVILAVGPDLRQGQKLDPALSALALKNTGGLTSNVVQVGSTPELLLAARSTALPELVALTTGPIDPSRATPNNTGPYRNFWIDLYNGTRPERSNLLITTYGANTLPSPVATASVRTGDLDWLIEASPKAPPAGTYASASPWLILGVGVVVALALAWSVELLARRNLHSARLVEERTADLLEAQRVIVRQERLSAVGEMAGVIGHELRNPMSAAVNNLFLARLVLGDGLSGDADRHLTAVDGQLNRAVRLLEDLTAYVREREPRFAEVDFSDLVDQVRESLPEPPGVTVSVDASTTITVDPSLMVQVLTNLITNAFQAMPEGGRVTLQAQRGTTTRIVVEDSGTGIDPAVADRLFDPFVSTKPEGTGLGLAIVQRLVEAQGGSVRLESTDGRGARILISFPGEA